MCNFFESKDDIKLDSSDKNLVSFIRKDALKKSHKAKFLAFIFRTINNIANLLIIIGSATVAILSGISAVLHNNPNVVIYVSYIALIISALIGIIKTLVITFNINQTSYNYEKIYIGYRKQLEKLINIEYQNLSDEDQHKALLKLLSESDNLTLSLFNNGLSSIPFNSINNNNDSKNNIDEKDEIV